MMAQILDGTAIARALRTRVASEVADFVGTTGIVPGLATVLVGEDPASQVYVRNKRQSAVAAGIRDLHRHVDADVDQETIAAIITELAHNDAVSGILLQLPLPGRLDSKRLINLIPPMKDVDGLTTLSAGLLARSEPGLRPCTPSGIMSLIDATGIDLDGADAVVIGRSELVGGPMARMLLDRNTTVTTAHSHTRDLAAVTMSADVLVVAAGVPGLIGAEHVKSGAVVIDVGIHHSENGLVGDVRFDEASKYAGWITPVPGGVGPMTIATLLENTLIAARMQAARPV
ncbi:bifunctional 5,10-methylenetetrahydrofolate dehydrogenase/5,10-methenyltetrahydrofolate cyclohydrolase [Naasia lichenicola]|uniref:Bifunctional protein FolD n=1 Tax=Naasia lichenicola TaxID=2565933 RepID=A0A4S4FID7_9MICO|nr:bifunctional 5,10-methylenetetrahydrofolate dehydrogenase/5,10-methenyltetrahydrofolate cyclohydrolase [Naasia lichenicola]THG30103.1 bifunctional 5,10-methylenetetrahydrofolate dehydrogenase/5,10-methenyltetrahydrofolate cyclohydrolase [Naasia lichenicola]